MSEEEVCEKNCEAYADDWINAYKNGPSPCGAYYTANIDAATETKLREDLIKICKLGCAESNNFLGNDTIDPSITWPADYSKPPASGTLDEDYIVTQTTSQDIAYTFNDVRDAYFLGQCTATVLHPPYIPLTEMECNYKELIHYIENDNFSPAIVDAENPTSAELSDIASHIDSDFGHLYSFTFTSFHVQEWFDYFLKGEGDISSTYPAALSCQGCTCDRLDGFF